MRKLFGIAFLLVAAIGLTAQTTYTPPVLPPIFNAVDITNSTTMMTNVNANVTVLENLLLKHDADLYSPSGSVASAIGKIPAGTQGPQGIPGPQGPPGPLATPHELLLVIPYGSTGFSILSLGAQTEYPPTQRTRRKADFTNVHQIRACANIIIPGGTGSNFIVQISSDTTYSTVVTTSPFDVSQASLTCTNWQNYSGPGGDQFTRILIGGSGSMQLDFISLQLR